MTIHDDYMLQRDSQESKRLNAQHEFLVSLSGGHLIHPSIRSKGLQYVADVATGTGVWLRDVAASSTFSTQANGKTTEFMGFDISPQQFPAAEDLPPNVKFVVQDVTKPFPSEYHDKFDLVNVRLLSYVIKAGDLEKIIRNTLQIIRPGGYLQWLECDPGDSWTTPGTQMSHAIINHVIAEKADRGFLPAIATPLAKTIQSYSTQIPNGHVNPISWSPELMRIIHLETKSSQDHPSPAVAAMKKPGILSVAVLMLEARAARIKALVVDPVTSSLQAEKLEKDMESITQLVEAVKRGEDEACNNWDMEMTWIVARKAATVGENDSWMAIKYPN